jgi:endonuclease/exonuclease/phosphatase family metal-dependent hydrolase
VLAPPPLGPLLFVHHKPNWQHGYEHERELQAVSAARFVEQLLADGDRHVVLAGDLDDSPDAASIRFWTGRQSLDGTSVRYEDAWEVVHPGEPGHTFTPRNPLVRAGEMPLERGRRIDDVMVRCGVHGPTLDVAACSLAFGRPVGGVWASDHFGLVADLELPRRPPGSWNQAAPGR